MGKIFADTLKKDSILGTLIFIMFINNIYLFLQKFNLADSDLDKLHVKPLRRA